MSFKIKLTYEDYCNYHASKCKYCNKQKRLLINGVWVSCSCQYNASVKWKFDQIQVYPDSLKYKTWSDFTGIDEKNRVISVESFVLAKQKALKYCFDSDDPSVVSNRNKNLSIHKRLVDGRNLIISGPKKTGKSLIATLILKEAIYSCTLNNYKMDFVWVKLNEIIDACRWDVTGKSIDFDLLDYWKDVDFMFIDNVDISPMVGNHRHPPDMLSLNKLFSSRMSKRLPNIVICSDKFYDLATTNSNEIKIQYGEDFMNLINHPCNTTIELKK